MDTSHGSANPSRFEHVPVLLVYGAAALAATWRWESPAGQGAALLAVAVSLWATRLQSFRRLRVPVRLAIGLAASGLGLAADSLAGGPAWVSQHLGARGTLALSGALTSGLFAAGTVVVLRTLTTTWRVFAAAEALAIAAGIVAIFDGHRDHRFDQPQFLVEWSTSLGYDPRRVLMAVGMVTLGALSLLLMRRPEIVRTLAAAILVTCAAAVGYAGLQSLPARVIRPAAVAAGAETRAPRGGPGTPTAESAPGPPSVQPDGPRGEGTRAKREEPDAPIADSPPTPPEAPSDEERLSFDPRQWPEQTDPVAIVTFHQDDGPGSGAYYFVQGTYSRLNEGRLVRSAARIAGDNPREFAAARTEFDDGTVPSRGERTVATTVSLITPQVRPLGLVAVRSMEPRPNADPRAFCLTYAVTSRMKDIPLETLFLARAGNPRWSPAVREEYLAVPADGRYRELLEEISREMIDASKLGPGLRASPMLRAVAVRRWLERRAVYARNAAHAEQADPTAAFLFGDRRGFCVHVAHAAVFLLRTAGIPARIAAGYVAEPGRRGQGSSLLLQAADAHAWCEVYLEGAGWVAVDPSLERSEEPATPPVAPAQQNYYAEKNRGEPVPDASDRGPSRGRLPWRMAWLLTLLPASPYAIKAWRRLAPRWAGEDQLDRLCFRAALDRLAEVGVIRQFGETREEFAHRIAGWAPEFQELTADHLRRAIAGREAATGARCRHLQARVAARVASAFPPGRRLRGLLDPLSWMHVR